jgi:hypothetical protein
VLGQRQALDDLLRAQRRRGGRQRHQDSRRRVLGAAFGL